MGEEEEREIEVRALNGESTKIWMPAGKCVKDLKQLLALTWPPAIAAAGTAASSTPNFHLFFKGVKLSLQSHLGSLDIQQGQFLVLVPFIKKDRPQNPKPDFSTNVPKQSSTSTFADSAHSDMMQEFSSLFERSGDTSGQPHRETENFDFGHKRKRDFDNFSDSCVDTGGPYAFVWSVLQTPNKRIIEEQNSEKFVEILNSLNCLKNPRSGKCMFFAAEVCKNKMVSCMCPLWLKRIIQAFSFLNIFSAFCQVQREEITLAKLKEALTQLGKFGCQASFEDIKHLCVLCPKVVSFANNDPTHINPADAVVIISSGNEERTETENNPANGQKGMSLSKAFSAMRKRERSFKSILQGAAKFLMSKSGNENAVPLSLKGLIKLINEGGTKVSGKEGHTKVTFCQSPTSSSHAFRQRCCRETNHLLPLAMIQHLREGIGSKGQMMHVEDIGAKKAIYAEVPSDLSDRTKSALKCMGITKLYSHQAESILASLAHKNVVVSTTTSSGKSLCYNVPVLEVLSQNLSSCALYLFPTKVDFKNFMHALVLAFSCKSLTECIFSSQNYSSFQMI
uniref:Putative ATP-dependent helicase YprA isoform X2 n=1 Tax=Rhizophora mucronata TaxID=61149 RepID=A0A2P2M9Z4_RHIMU